jgi:antibiotic biosynthesis monooxygenase (ABM) superfamily enzyme
MIFRIWHGFTTIDNANEYEHLLKEEIFPGIAAKQINGYLGMQLLRRTIADEVEFTTIMRFESIDAIKEFVGEDYEAVYVPEKARLILKRFDQRSIHCEERHLLQYD